MKLVLCLLTFCAGLPAEVDPQLHADVLKLLEVNGIRQRIEATLPTQVEAGKQALKKSDACNAAFAEEWAKRMLARLKADDFLQVFVEVYEKHFSDDEIKQLIAIAKPVDGKPAFDLSPDFRKKVQDLQSTIQSEIMGGNTQVGAKVGGDVGTEIQKEHPEYCKDSQ